MRSGPKPRPVGERFWKFVQKEPGSNGCWVWTGARGDDGGGRVSVNNMAKTAYRVSWELHFGPIPDGLGVCHHCDNRPCVRPDHLFLGDQLANLQDAAKKGRLRGFKANLPRGEKHYKAVLTLEQAREILGSAESGTVLARKFGVTRGAITGVRKGNGWKLAVSAAEENAA